MRRSSVGKATRGISEREAIALLSRALGGKARGVGVGIGDDAAVLASVRGQLVFSVDASVENVHFRREWLGLADVGARALHAAVSDLAAMGARPLAALVGLILPRPFSAKSLRELSAGQKRAARELDCPIVGGNIARGSELSVTTAVLGVAKRPLCRSGARPGDELWLAGDLGLALAGLRWLERGDRRALGRAPRAIRACCDAWRCPRARLREGARLARSAHAMIDVSDGLAGDAEHLASASGVRVVIDAEALGDSLSPLLGDACALLLLSPLETALLGGEDYALLAAGPARRRPPFVHRIGRIEAGRGVYLEVGGKKRRLRGGFDHLA